MPRLFSQALLFEKNRVSSDHVWTLLFQVEIAEAGGIFRLAAYDQDLLFHGQWYSAFPLTVDALEEPTHAALVNLRVSVSNVDQEMIALLENYWVATGDPHWNVRIYTIDARQPDETPLEAGEFFTVQQVSTDFLSATYDLIAEGVTLSAIIPKRRFCAANGFPNLPRTGR